ncbi:hypothetical protein LAZ67_X000634 [Cordylochernes scorpioides]|uniref:Transposase n=1 Tax=Cordylochernes scorpioides TaxID=51811 RepID=A0ABY6LRS5_9ARAC|nr:hypothetical protein LAZ67_X000634 [Cordylochernes scorpioides]
MDILSFIILIFIYKEVKSQAVFHESVKGIVEGGNYTYYSLNRAGRAVIFLHTYYGDADIYVSDRNGHPTFEPDTHILQSVTCGLDRVDVADTLKRPITIAVYGHPSHDISKYELEVVIYNAVSDGVPLVSPTSCELWSLIHFLAAKKNSVKDIHTDSVRCMSSGMVRRQVREFKNGRIDLHDEPRVGQSSVLDETIAKFEAAMLEDRRVTVRKLCDLDPDVSKTTIDKILRGTFRVCARWVPKILTEDHKRQRIEAAQKFLDCHETDGEEFLDSIVTGDETWVHYTTPEAKEQSKQWKHTSSPKSLKFKQTLSAAKLMATIFWDRKGLLLCNFMCRGTTINSDRYCETLKQLRRTIQNKRRGMLTKGVRFHHNAWPHTARQTTALIEEF